MLTSMEGILCCCGFSSVHLQEMPNRNALQFDESSEGKHTLYIFFMDFIEVIFVCLSQLFAVIISAASLEKSNALLAHSSTLAVSCYSNAPQFAPFALRVF